MNAKQLKRLQHGITKLAYGDVLPKGFEFNMAKFADPYHLSEASVCGSVGCLLGSLSYVFPKSVAISWRIFAYEFVSDSREWKWVFDEDWAEYDNSMEGALQRAQYLIDHGVPDNFTGVGGEIEWKDWYENAEVRNA